MVSLPLVLMRPHAHRASLGHRSMLLDSSETYTRDFVRFLQLFVILNELSGSL